MKDPTKRTAGAERLPSSDLEAWLAGDLAPGSDEERALLAQEPELVEELERHRALRAAVRALPAELEPDRDLWPGVEARIARGGPGSWLAGPWRPTMALPLAALAAALAVVIGAVWLLRQAPSASPPGAPALAVAPSAGPAPPQAPPPAARPAAERLAAAPEPAPARPQAPAGQAAPRRPTSPPARAAREPATPAPAEPDLAVPALAAYAETDRQLAALGAELRRTIEERQERLPPATRQIVFDNLATIERALAEIEAALAGSPGDVELARTYIEYRQREISVLRRANAMAARL